MLEGVDMRGLFRWGGGGHWVISCCSIKWQASGHHHHHHYQSVAGCSCFAAAVNSWPISVCCYPCHLLAIFPDLLRVVPSADIQPCFPWWCGASKETALIPPIHLQCQSLTLSLSYITGLHTSFPHLGLKDLSALWRRLLSMNVRTWYDCPHVWATGLMALGILLPVVVTQASWYTSACAHPQEVSLIGNTAEISSPGCACLP